MPEGWTFEYIPNLIKYTQSFGQGLAKTPDILRDEFEAFANDEAIPALVERLAEHRVTGDLEAGLKYEVVYSDPGEVTLNVFNDATDDQGRERGAAFRTGTPFSGSYFPNVERIRRYIAMTGFEAPASYQGRFESGKRESTMNQAKALDRAAYAFGKYVQDHGTKEYPYDDEAAGTLDFQRLADRIGARIVVEVTRR